MTRPRNAHPGKHTNLRLPEATLQAARRAMELSGAQTLSEVVRRALPVYVTLLEARMTGLVLDGDGGVSPVTAPVRVELPNGRVLDLVL